MNQQMAQNYINEITKRMVSDGYPVEATHKINHSTEYVPTSAFAWNQGEEWDEDSIASILVGAWFSKAALINLVKVIRKIEKETRQ